MGKFEMKIGKSKELVQPNDLSVFLGTNSSKSCGS